MTLLVGWALKSNWKAVGYTLTAVVPMSNLTWRVVIVDLKSI